MKFHIRSFLILFFVFSGVVRGNEWLQKCIRRQQVLSRNVEIDLIVEISTHNSYNAANRYFVMNESQLTSNLQWLSVSKSEVESYRAAQPWCQKTWLGCALHRATFAPSEGVSWQHRRSGRLLASRQAIRCNIWNRTRTFLRLQDLHRSAFNRLWPSYRVSSRKQRFPTNSARTGKTICRMQLTL